MRLLDFHAEDRVVLGLFLLPWSSLLSLGVLMEEVERLSRGGTVFE